MRACAFCETQFQPARPLQQVCSALCASKKVRKERAEHKAKAKLERTMDRNAREALKTIPQLIKEAQVAFNAYIRERDKDKPCICCDLPLGTGEVGGAYDCGHYRSTGSAPHLRFDERNAHAQRKVCNRWGAGRAVDYRLGLIHRIGLEAVEALESSNAPAKWDRDGLRAIKVEFVDKLKQLRKGKP